jgi:cyclomaltodextrinase
MSLKPGKYRHFKGGEYAVQGVARHSENEELLVVYTPLYGEGGLWVRPLDMFLEQVQHDGELRSRFEFVGSLD